MMDCFRQSICARVWRWLCRPFRRRVQINPFTKFEMPVIHGSKSPGEPCLRDVIERNSMKDAGP